MPFHPCGSANPPEGYPCLDPTRCGGDARSCAICARPQCLHRVAAAPEPRRPPAEREVEELRARLRAIKDQMTLEIR